MKFWKKHRKSLHVLLAIMLILGLVGGSVAGVAHFLTSPPQPNEGGASQEDLMDYWQGIEEDLLAELEEEPEDVDTLIQLANLYYEKGNYYLYHQEHQARGLEVLKDSQSYYDKSLEIEPDLPEARFNRALINFTLGEVDEAGHELKELTTDYPEEGYFRFYYGMYLYSVEAEYQEAIEQWETLLEEDLEDPWLEEETSYWLGRAQEAIEEE